MWNAQPKPTAGCTSLWISTRPASFADVLHSLRADDTFQPEDPERDDLLAMLAYAADGTHHKEANHVDTNRMS